MSYPVGLSKYGTDYPPASYVDPYYKESADVINWIEAPSTRGNLWFFDFPVDNGLNSEGKPLLEDITITWVGSVHGCAPYVGDYYCYVWNVAVDTKGRWISSNAIRMSS